MRACLFIILGIAALAYATSCEFNPQVYNASVGEETRLLLSVSGDCGQANVSYSCGESGTAGVPKTFVAASDAECNARLSLPCSYPHAGEYSVKASLLSEDGSSLDCLNEAMVNVTCGSGQDGVACSPPSCAPDLLRQEGVCSSGSCVVPPVLSCSLSNYCQQASCNSSAYYCSFNSTSAKYGWSEDPSLCAQYPQCPPAYCEGLSPSLSHVSFNYSNNTCLQNTVSCAAGGCCAPSCNATGCFSSPGACADECSPYLLKVSGSCSGCGGAGANGVCSYSPLECGPQNLCQSAVCGTTTYYCIKDGVSYIWSENRLSCLPQSIPASTPSAAPRDGFIPAGAPPEVDVPYPEGFGATPLPSSAGIQRRISVTTEPSSVVWNAVIGVTGYYFEPPVINADSKARAFVFTDSALPLLRNLKCDGPSKCICRPPFNGSYSNFVCEIYPKASGVYYLTLANTANESGRFAASLVPGKSALLLKLVVASRTGEFLFYASVFVAFCLLLYGLHHLYTRFEHERRKGATLSQQKQHLLEEMGRAKAAYMKRQISEEDFKQAVLRIQKDLTEVNARLREFEEAKKKE